jgi:glycosyltransferase involved in cell wall biosynthesis
MKVSCFSFIREGVRLGYPFEESIRSALPLCDEFVIAVGESDDGTLERLQAMNEPKLRLIPTRWNEACRTHGFVYGHQKVIAQYNCVGDWAFYLEGDEVLHEDDLDRLRGAMAHYLDDTEVEALVFDYFHFYGDAEHLHLPPATYRRAARVIRNSLRSFAPDGLYWAVIKDRTWYGGRNKRRTRYPRAAALNIPLYHYGNARHARYLLAKAEAGNRYWEKDVFYSTYGRVDPQAVAAYTGSHPAVVQPWLQSHANPAFGFDPEYRPSRRERKHRRLRVLERKFGWDFSKRHFKVVREYGKGARAAAVRAVT